MQHFLDWGVATRGIEKNIIGSFEVEYSYIPIK